MSEDTENSGRKISIENVGGDFVAGDKHIHLPQKHIPHDLTHLPDIVDLEREVIGREADLESLGQQLESDSMTVLLNGMGGIGKAAPGGRTAKFSTASSGYCSVAQPGGVFRKGMAPGKQYMGGFDAGVTTGHLTVY